MEAVVTCKDGSLKYIRFGLASIGNRNIVTFEDLTTFKQVEEEIRKLNQKLEQKVQERTRQLIEAQEDLVKQEKLAAMGKIAGVVGHEIRNPLGVINNAVYFLKTVLQGADDAVREYLEMIRGEVV